MIIRAEQIFDKVYLDEAQRPSEFISYISKATERELITKLMNELCDHKLHVVQLHEPGLIEDLPMEQEVAYRQNLEVSKLVQCKDCTMSFPWCHKFRYELGGYGYCPYGKEIMNDEQ